MLPADMSDCSCFIGPDDVPLTLCWTVRTWLVVTTFVPVVRHTIIFIVVARPVQLLRLPGAFRRGCIRIQILLDTVQTDAVLRQDAVHRDVRGSVILDLLQLIQCAIQLHCLRSRLFRRSILDLAHWFVASDLSRSLGEALTCFRLPFASIFCASYSVPPISTVDVLDSSDAMVTSSCIPICSKICEVCFVIPQQPITTHMTSQVNGSACV